MKSLYIVLLTILFVWHSQAQFYNNTSFNGTWSTTTFVYPTSYNSSEYCYPNTVTFYNESSLEITFPSESQCAYYYQSNGPVYISGVTQDTNCLHWNKYSGDDDANYWTIKISYCNGSSQLQVSLISYLADDEVTYEKSEVYMTLDQPPQTPNITYCYAINTYLSPYPALPQICYPTLVMVEDTSSDSEMVNGEWNLEYLFTFIWGDTGACEGISNYQDYVNVVCNQSNQAASVCSVEGSNISGTWSEKNQTFNLAFSFAQENGSEIYDYELLLVPAAPLIPPISGEWYVRSYISPNFYQTQYCYPLSIQIAYSNSTPTVGDGGWIYTYEFEWQFPSVEACEDSGLSYDLNTAVEVATNGGSNSVQFEIYANNGYSVYGTWIASDNTFEIEIIEGSGGNSYAFTVSQLGSDSESSLIY